MPKKIVIIGAVALGPKVACRARRVDPTAEVLLIEQNRDFSYGGCGLPFFVSGDVSDIQALMSTSFHMVRDAYFFKEAKGVEVQDLTRAVSVDRSRQSVRVRHLVSGEESDIPYDVLVLATGSTPFKPDLPGLSLQGVTTVSNPSEAMAIKESLSKGRVGQCVVIGAGPIGLEMAQAVSDLWGVETTVLEVQNQILPGLLDPDLARMVLEELKSKEVTVRLGERVLRFIGNKEGNVQTVVTDQGELPADLVILAVGVRPNTFLARQAGLSIGPAGGISVNEFLQTSDPLIYAGGDCVEVPHLITGRSCVYPSGSLANRQGRVIGSNAAGGHETFPGVIGSFAIKLFDLSAGRCGLTLAAAREAGFAAREALVIQADRAHFYPGQELMALRLVGDQKTGRILGLSGIGRNGDALMARLNAVAAGLPAKMTIEELSNLELPYSPPFASAMDILNAVANTLKNTMEGKNRPLPIGQFQEFFSDRENKSVLFLDVRGPKNAQPYVDQHGPFWVNIPQETLARRVAELPAAETTVLICNSGVRSYEAQIILDRAGIKNTYNLEGGVAGLKWSGLNPLEKTDEE
jgi:NADPH-dependent 2,4-dienoyl-CoA reductase/sulfur reductase-like enzyme/rhodanese-related sulfurtransferase